MDCQGATCKPILILGPETSLVLQSKTTPFAPTETALAVQIALELIATLKNRNGPAAGLAATQIGYSRSIFVYTYNRQIETLRACVNPSYQPDGDKKIESWEGCLSTMTHLKVARIMRHESIIAEYDNPLTGQHERVLLDGFAARVFQHESDHLQGVLSIEHPEKLEVRTFETEKALNEHMTAVRAKDTVSYNAPKHLIAG